MEPSEIWAKACDRVRQQIADPTVWLAMQAARPLLIDGSFFVAALPKQEEYLAVHLQNAQATTAIEEALQSIAGRILAFRLIIGNSVADWNAEKPKGETSDAGHTPAEPPPAFFRSEATPAPSAPEPTSEPTSEPKREVSPHLGKAVRAAEPGVQSRPVHQIPAWAGAVCSFGGQADLGHHGCSDAAARCAARRCPGAGIGKGD